MSVIRVRDFLHQVGYDAEEAYFHEKNAQLIHEIRMHEQRFEPLVGLSHRVPERGTTAPRAQILSFEQAAAERRPATPELKKAA